MYFYEDKEKLQITDSIGITKEVKFLVETEKKRLLKEEKRKVSRAKIVNNLIIEKYGDARLRSKKGVETVS